MTIPRLYLPRPLQEQGLYPLDEGHQRYLINVLRLCCGDAVTLFDGSGWDYQGRIEKLADGEAAVRIVGRKEIAGAAPRARITLAQALPKGAKMEGIVEKATELGVSQIIPFHSSRSIPRWEPAKAAARVARWEKIAVEAARRCRRPDVPAIEAVTSFGEMLALAGAGKMPRPVRIIFWEEGGRSFQSLLRDDGIPPPGDFFFVIGPEGGFTPLEVAAAQEAGFAVASLGNQILRVETASLVILAILQYERGIFSAPEAPAGGGKQQTPAVET